MALLKEVNKNIGYNIRVQRLLRGLRGNELADLIKTTKQSISLYETGVRPVPKAVLNRIAESLDVEEEVFEEPIREDVLSLLTHPRFHNSIKIRDSLFLLLRRVYNIKGEGV